MDVHDIETMLRNFILDNFFFGVESISYQNSDSLMAKGIVDSTGILELITFIEGQFSISVEDDELVPENLDSIDNLIAYIGRKALY
jgi:acyl carrier protein